MNDLRVQGAAAELRWGYHRAATLSAWSVGGTPGAWTLSAIVLDADAFRVSQRPLKVVTPNGWQWPVHTLQMTGRSLTAVIGPMET